jgi:hypothetical protein
MRRHLFTPLAASAVLAIIVAACGGSATPAPSAAAPSVAASVAPSVEASPSPEASVAAAASVGADASGALPSIALPSLNADKDLEALLPTTFGGVTLQKFSMKGAQFLGQSSNAELSKALSSLGLTAADVSVAFAADPTGKMEVTFVAIRFAGADSGKLLQVFQAASQTQGSIVTSVNVGGKDVIKTQDKSGSLSYFYVKNDTVLGVSAKTDAAAGPALQVLP